MTWRTLARQRSVLVAAAILVIVAVVWAVTLSAPRPPETLDQRVTDVASQLQCLQCQGESVADSSSLFAQDVRGIIRTRLRQGQSEQQVVNYLVSIYGDRIREVPPTSGFTLLIWLGPLVMLLAGILVVAAVARQWRAPVRPSAGADEELPELAGLSPSELAFYQAQLEADLTPTALFPAPKGEAGTEAAPGSAAPAGGAGAGAAARQAVSPATSSSPDAQAGTLAQPLAPAGSAAPALSPSGTPAPERGGARAEGSSARMEVR